jgi:hypothetical protein
MSRNSQESQARDICKMAIDQFDFYHCPSGDVFAVSKDGPRIARFLRGGRLSLRAELSNRFRLAQKDRPPSAAALADAMLSLEGHAMDQPTQEVHLRVAHHEDKIYIDLGDNTGRAVRVDSGGWAITSECPLFFRRTALTSPLPIPDAAGSAEELREFINATDSSWPLLRGWLVAALTPDIPHAIMLFEGTQGSGKSTAGCLISQVVDPSGAPLRSEPRDPEGWITAAAGSWLVTLDNLSGMPPWLSDCLCKACTGDAMVRRKLYTDSDLVVTSFRRAVVLTSIDLGALRGDLADRLAVVNLEAIPGRARRTDASIHSAFAAARGRIFGGLLNLLAQAISLEPALQIDDLPRLADFARICRAVDLATDTMPGGFEMYMRQRTTLANDVIESDPLASAIVQLMSEQDQWRGTASALLEHLETQAGLNEGQRRPRMWPSSPKALGGRLRRLAPALSEAGILIEHERDTARGRQRLITLTNEGEG